MSAKFGVHGQASKCFPSAQQYSRNMFFPPFFFRACCCRGLSARPGASRRLPAVFAEPLRLAIISRCRSRLRGGALSKSTKTRSGKRVPMLQHTVDGRNPAPLGNHGKPLLIGIFRGFIIPGFLRWCRILSIHSITHILGRELPERFVGSGIYAGIIVGWASQKPTPCKLFLFKNPITRVLLVGNRFPGRS